MATTVSQWTMAPTPLAPVLEPVDPEPVDPLLSASRQVSTTLSTALKLGSVAAAASSTFSTMVLSMGSLLPRVRALLSAGMAFCTVMVLLAGSTDTTSALIFLLLSFNDEVDEVDDGGAWVSGAGAWAKAAPAAAR